MPNRFFPGCDEPAEPPPAPAAPGPDQDAAKAVTEPVQERETNKPREEGA